MTPIPTRRSFLGATATALAAASDVGAAPDSATLPRVRLGKHSVSRLICGNNCFNGNSHSSVLLNEEMRRYYSPDQVMRTLRRCQEVGIDTWQAGFRNLPLHRRHLDEGGSLQLIAIENGDPAKIDALAKGGCIALAHHGEATDRAYKTGQLDSIRDYLKRIRDSGMAVGVSSHMPAVFDVIESKGWDVDYFQTCLYERHRSAADLEALLGQAPLPVGEVYLPKDPARMFRIIQQTRKPCLAFKILAAGRRAQMPAAVEQAFSETFSSIKSGDAVIVGMYDRLSDQPGQNAALARRYGATSATPERTL
jgi:hypothetical protein